MRDAVSAYYWYELSTRVSNDTRAVTGAKVILVYQQHEREDVGFILWASVIMTRPVLRCVRQLVVVAIQSLET